MSDKDKFEGFKKKLVEENEKKYGKMYVDEPRFKAYYDRGQPGRAEFLRDAILIYTGE